VQLERREGSWLAAAGSLVGIIVAAVVASFIQTALEHWVIDYFGTTMTLTLESVAIGLAITFLLPFLVAAAFGYFLVFVPTVFAPSRKTATSNVLFGIVVIRAIVGLVASLSAVAGGAHWSFLPQPDVFTVSPLFPLSMLVAVAAAWRGRADALATAKHPSDAGT